MSGRNDSPDEVKRGGRFLGLGVGGTRLSDEESRILESVAPAAIILFARNVETPEQLVDLIGAIRRASDPAPVLMIDEEGGRVDRLRAIAPGLPAAADFEQCVDDALALQFGRTIGQLLAEFDIEVNLAPVVDLWREGRSPSLLNRCFGSDPAAVALHAAAFIKGMADQGVLSCLKHFPGLGVADTDPHHAASVVDLSLEELSSSDLEPYRLLTSVAPSVMVSHGVYPAIDASGLPGTLSFTISTEMLRTRLGYEGLAVTDDMEMHAVADTGSAGSIAERSLLAGNDLILFCSRMADARSIAARLGSLTEDETSRARVDQARERVDRFVRQCGAWTDRREAARRGIEQVRRSVGELRDAMRGA